MGEYYVLKDRSPVRVDDVQAWALEFDGASRVVAKDTKMGGDVSVSTVFLGIDQSFGDGPPLLFETMIFGGEHDGYQDRYSTWADAEAGHAKALHLAMSTAKDPQ